MNKRHMLLLTVWYVVLLTATAQARLAGIPFFRNYTAEEYGANNRNADILADGEGRVFAANFEGLLYFDHATWRMARLTNLTRPTALFLDRQGTLWVGGYNYFGRASVTENGQLRLVEESRHSNLQAEVSCIWEEHEGITFRLTNGSVLGMRANRLTPLSATAPPEQATPSGYDDIDASITQVLPLGTGLRAVATMGHGLFLYDEQGTMLCNVSEQNGLCSNNINRLATDGKGMLWGATENGLFVMSVPTRFSRIGHTEGLHGEVYSMTSFKEQMYVGTTSGLYRRSNGLDFMHVGDVSHLCWDMKGRDGQLLVASEGGLYSVKSDGSVEKLNGNATRALLVKDDQIYTAEADGLYMNGKDGGRRQVCKVPNITRILVDESDGMWVESLYGEIWYRSAGETLFSQYSKTIGYDENHHLMRSTLVKTENGVVVLDALDTEPFPYAMFSYAGKDGTLWLTDKTGKGLYAWKDGRVLQQYAPILFPLRKMVVRCLWEEGDRLWIGGESGLTAVDRSHSEVASHHPARLRICSVTVNGDSVAWGGFGIQPDVLPELGNKENNLLFTFALDSYGLQSTPLYQYRMDGGEWSRLTGDVTAQFNNQRFGQHEFQVRAVDSEGHFTDVSSMQFYISMPFFLRWYMLLVYASLLAWCVSVMMKWRTRRLETEKRRLESIVSERTAEVVQQRDEIALQRDEIVQQKDEIEQKSKSLETALSELSLAQSELIRQEKMATVGKLTQGLIDRILNPLNYINNFSKLSLGLLKDIEANIDDEKDAMTADNYEDTKDVLSMLSVNLNKVSEHGQNTTITLKAMEEMLKDRTGGIVATDLCVILRQDEEIFKNYYSKDIAASRIAVVFAYPAQPIMVNANAEQLSKVFMSILANAVYAVLKKAQRTDYTPQIQVIVKETDEKVEISFRDNGIGIEETVLDKVFDPFFTTKTTSEAAGVGLYLSREIVQNHQGDIKVQSEKDQYTEMTIVLPKIR